jgi:hypothetical protein
LPAGFPENEKRKGGCVEKSSCYFQSELLKGIHFLSGIETMNHYVHTANFWFWWLSREGVRLTG